MISDDAFRKKLQQMGWRLASRVEDNVEHIGMVCPICAKNPSIEIIPPEDQ